MTLRKIIAAALIISVFLLPGFTLAASLPVIRGENVLVLFVLAYSANQSRNKGICHNRDVVRVTRAFGLMACLAILSILLPSIVFSSNVIFKDFMILPMLFTYWMIFWFFQYMHDTQARIFCLHIIIISIALCAGVGVLQHFNLLGINYWLSPLYLKGNRLDPSIIRVIEGAFEARIGGTHGDPRHYGYLLVVGVSVCTAWLLQIRNQKIMKIVVIGALGLSFVSIAYTLSRTTILSTIICLIIAIFLSTRGVRSAGQSIAFLILLISMGWFLSFSYSTESFEHRVMRTDTYSFMHSKNARIRDLKEPFIDALNNPIIFLVGRGPSKSVMRTNSHNDYGWYFHRFGLPGLFFYISLIFMGLRAGYFSYRHARTKEEKVLAMTSFLAMVNWSIFAMAESVFKDGQLMALNMIFLGLLYPARLMSKHYFGRTAFGMVARAKIVIRKLPSRPQGAEVGT